MPRAVLCLPTYNERENAELIIRKVMSLPRAFDVLIVDDGSPDGTGGFAFIDAPEGYEIELIQRRPDASRLPV